MKKSNIPAVGMELPKLYTVIYKDDKGKFKYFFSNNLDLCEKKAALNDGDIYIDNRFAAKVRLYWFLVRKQLYPKAA